MGTTYGFCSSLAESITNIHITTCELESQWELAARRREPNAGALDNLKGWEEEEAGREVQEGGDICMLMANSC